MKYLIDTSSLLILSKHIIPIDNDEIIISFLNDKISSGELLIIDGVVDESKLVSQGIIIETFPIMHKRSMVVNTTEIILSGRSHNMLDNNFCYMAKKNRLEDAEYDVIKQSYLASADGRIISFLLHPTIDSDFCLITEESNNDNDGKFFKKLPSICEQINIESISIVEYLTRFNSLSITSS